MRRLLLGVTLLCVTPFSSAHDDTVGARFVQTDGANATDCLDHDVPCQSIQFALSQAESGNTVKAAAGIYDMTGVDPESFLFGPTKAAGGYSPEDHFHDQDPDANRTIIVGVDQRYRAALMKQGFTWAPSMAFAQFGLVDTTPAPALQAQQSAAMNCSQGFAGQFPCHNVDFLGQIPLNSFSSKPTSMANLWGFRDLNDDREYAVVGLHNGTAIVDVTDPANPREVGFVSGNSSTWREAKVYQYRDVAANRYRAYAYISTEAPNSGLQVIDLSGLPNSVALATTLQDTGRQHTLSISNVEQGTNVAKAGAQAFLYSAGSDQNAGAWRVYSLTNPASPTLITAAPANTQYMHDSTHLYITDSRTSQCEPGHSPCQVLVDYNENTVDLWDVTNKNAPVKLSSTTYPTVEYTHSGWPTEDQMHLFVHDELEEIRRGLKTEIYTMDISNLRSPTIVTSYTGDTTATDHNGYTKGNFYYTSHYRRGLVVFDATNPNQLREVASLDTFLQPSANTAGTDGAWGVYPFLPSGTILISDISNGLFVMKDKAASLAGSVGQIGFIGTAATVNETVGTATVRVQRNNGSQGAVSIQYATSNGTAASGSDYTAANGTLSWAAGDVSEKTISVPITDDTAGEGDETITLTLSGATGGSAIEGSSTYTLTVGSNDGGATPPPSTGGGGGGKIDLQVLLALLGVLILQLRAARRLRASSLSRQLSRAA